jgi:hypothetical protein
MTFKKSIEKLNSILKKRPLKFLDVLLGMTPRTFKRHKFLKNLGRSLSNLILKTTGDRH